MGTSSMARTNGKMSNATTGNNKENNNNAYETTPQMNMMTYDGYGHDIKNIIQNKTSINIGYPIERYPRTNTTRTPIQRIYPSYVTDLPIYQQPTIITTTPSYCDSGYRNRMELQRCQYPRRLVNTTPFNEMLANKNQLPSIPTQSMTFTYNNNNRDYNMINGQNQCRKSNIIGRDGEQEVINGNTPYKIHNYSENGHDRLTFNNDANIPASHYLRRNNNVSSNIMIQHHYNTKLKTSSLPRQNNSRPTVYSQGRVIHFKYNAPKQDQNNNSVLYKQYKNTSNEVKKVVDGNLSSNKKTSTNKYLKPANGSIKKKRNVNKEEMTKLESEILEKISPSLGPTLAINTNISVKELGLNLASDVPEAINSALNYLTMYSFFGKQDNTVNNTRDLVHIILCLIRIIQKSLTNSTSPISLKDKDSSDGDDEIEDRAICASNVLRNLVIGMKSHSHILMKSSLNLVAISQATLNFTFENMSPAYFELCFNIMSMFKNLASKSVKIAYSDESKSHVFIKSLLKAIRTQAFPLRLRLVILEAIGEIAFNRENASVISNALISDDEAYSDLIYVLIELINITDKTASEYVDLEYKGELGFKNIVIDETITDNDRICYTWKLHAKALKTAIKMSRILNLETIDNIQIENELLFEKRLLIKLILDVVTGEKRHALILDRIEFEELTHPLAIEARHIMIIAEKEGYKTISSYIINFKSLVKEFEEKLLKLAFEPSPCSDTCAKLLVMLSK